MDSFRISDCLRSIIGLVKRHLSQPSKKFCTVKLRLHITSTYWQVCVAGLNSKALNLISAFSSSPFRGAINGAAADVAQLMMLFTPITLVPIGLKSTAAKKILSYFYKKFDYQIPCLPLWQRRSQTSFHLPGLPWKAQQLSLTFCPFKCHPSPNSEEHKAY